MEIPKVIHQIWLGTRPVPQRFSLYMKTWREHFPGWEWMLWRDSDVEAVGPELLCKSLLENREWNVGVRSDILRVDLLRLYGGVYADCDIECLRPWGRLLREGCFHYSDEAPGVPNNGLMASPPGHGLAQRLCEDWSTVLPQAAGRAGFMTADAIKVTGPERLKHAADCWVAGCWREAEPIYDEGRTVGARWPRDLVSFWAEGFCPEYWTGEAEPFRSHRAAHTPYAYVWHHFTGSWSEHWNGK